LFLRIKNRRKTSLLFLFLSVLFAEPFEPFREKFQATPTVLYQELPGYEESNSLFYMPVESPLFTEINRFKNIHTGSAYEYDIPILLAGNNLLVTARIQEEFSDLRRPLDLFSVNIETGHVYWQTTVDSISIATDGKRVFAETMRETGDIFAPGSLTAYDVTSGEILWQTTFELQYAARVQSLALKPPDLVVNTSRRPHFFYYILDPETGEIKERRDRYPFFEEPTYNGLVFSKEGYGRVSPIVAKRESDGSVVWRYEQPVVSNIAVGGPVTYFVTRDAQLIAVDTQTGNVLGSLNFTPGFPEDIHFENDHIIVAADGDLVAVYFRDRRQLSIFRFSPDNLDD
jgi:hypothetical protein